MASLSSKYFVRHSPNTVWILKLFKRSGNYSLNDDKCLQINTFKINNIVFTIKSYLTVRAFMCTTGICESEITKHKVLDSSPRDQWKVCKCWFNVEPASYGRPNCITFTKAINVVFRENMGPTPFLECLLMSALYFLWRVES